MNTGNSKLVEIIARVCHAANREYCQQIGDAVMPPWDECPDWQRESLRAGVIAHLENPVLPPEVSHANWMKRKLEEGWTYGPVKDAVAKTHPCILPYDELPVEQQMKDDLFGAIIHALRVD